MVIKILGLRLENKKGQQNLLTFFIELKSESTDKPGSVVDNHSSGTNVTACLKQPTRSQRGSRHLETYLVLLRVGFTLPLLLPTARCALTAPFHPYLASQAVSFLLHFPWAHTPQALPGTLTSGARTFLHRLRRQRSSNQLAVNLRLRGFALKEEISFFFTVY